MDSEGRVLARRGRYRLEDVLNREQIRDLHELAARIQDGKIRKRYMPTPKVTNRR